MSPLALKPSERRNLLARGAMKLTVPRSPKGGRKPRKLELLHSFVVDEIRWHRAARLKVADAGKIDAAIRTLERVKAKIEEVVQ